MSVLADAGKNIEDLPAVGTGVLHAIRRPLVAAGIFEARSISVY